MRRIILLFLLLLSFNSLELRSYAQPNSQNEYEQTKSTNEITRRKKEFKSFGKRKDKTAIPLLIKGMKDKNPDIRTSATWALANIADKSTIPYLIEALKDDDYRVRGNAVWGLGEIGDDSVVQPIIETLKDRRKEVRQNAAISLANLGMLVVPQLIKALEVERLNGKQDENERRYKIHGIAFALARIKDKSAVPHLFKLLNDQDWNVIIDVTESLCMMEDDSITYDLIKYAAGDITKAKEELLKQGNEAVNKLEGWEQLQYVVALMPTAANIQSGMLNAGKPIIPVLMRALDDENQQIRLFAIGLLTELCVEYPTYNKRTLIESFIARLGDKVPVVRHALGVALESITNIKYKTGEDFGEDKKKWQEWWEKNKDILGIDEITPGAIKADKIVDLGNSLVMHEVSTVNNEIVLIYVKYKETRPNPEVFDVNFSIADSKKDGDYSDFIETEQGQRIKITYTYKNNKLAYFKFDTDFRPAKLREPSSNTFTVVSKGGYKIDFIFYWKDGEIDFIKILPRVNPFTA